MALPPPPPLANRDPTQFKPFYSSQLPQQPQEDPNSWPAIIKRRGKTAAFGFAMGGLVGSVVVGLHYALSIGVNRKTAVPMLKNMAISGGSFGTIFMVGSFIRQ
jgi:hypothetical protein